MIPLGIHAIDNEHYNMTEDQSMRSLLAVYRMITADSHERRAKLITLVDPPEKCNVCDNYFNGNIGEYICDVRISTGPWAYTCEDCYKGLKRRGKVRVGIGNGQIYQKQEIAPGEFEYVQVAGGRAGKDEFAPTWA